MGKRSGPAPATSESQIGRKESRLKLNMPRHIYPLSLVVRSASRPFNFDAQSGINFRTRLAFHEQVSHHAAEISRAVVAAHS